MIYNWWLMADDSELKTENFGLLNNTFLMLLKRDKI